MKAPKEKLNIFICSLRNLFEKLMKAAFNYCLVLFGCLLASNYTYSQITLVSSDLAQVGDTVTRYVDTLATITPGAAGANVTWTLTNATARVTETTKVIAPSATPHAASFTNSNIAMTNDNQNYLYFNKSSADFIATGLAGNLLNNGNTIVAPLNPTLTANVFPSTYGTTFQDNYGMDVTTSGSSFGVNSVRFKRAGVLSDTIDGWGNLVTPVGSYQALRIKHTDRTIDTTWIKLLPISPWSVYSTKNTTTISYSWMAKNAKLAIAELAYDTLGNPKRFTWSSLTLTTGISENTLNNTIQLFPNPASSYFDFKLSDESTSLNGFIQIENSIGQTVYKEAISSQTGRIFLDKIQHGVYLVRIMTEDGRRFYNRLIIN